MNDAKEPAAEPGSVPDLLTTLRTIADRAARAHAAIRTGRATTGVSALAEIHNTARDAVRHGERHAVATIFADDAGFIDLVRDIET